MDWYVIRTYRTSVPVQPVPPPPRKSRSPYIFGLILLGLGLLGSQESKQQQKNETPAAVKPSRPVVPDTDYSKRSFPKSY